jgi:hypothetical protein
MRIATSLAVVTLAMVPGSVAAQSGYAYGADHCYYFQVPEGWQMDNRAAAGDGVPMVFYPNGSTWESAEIAMYTRPSAQLQPDTNAIKAQVEAVIAMHREASETVVAKQAERVQTKSGVSGQLWTFSGYQNGGTELVVYFLGRKTVNYFVAQVPGGASLDKAKQALLDLTSSYREGTDCKPCKGATGSCKRAK